MLSFISGQSHLKFVAEAQIAQTFPQDPAKQSNFQTTQEISPAHVWLMAFSVGAVVANMYYIQPLLSTIAATFHISVPKVGSVAMLTQLGGALGMLVFVPLGDTKERRSEEHTSELQSP